MNKKPVSYLQTDARWKNKPYRVKGENATIGGSGCGPTAAAMLIETITGKKFTPEDACNWSMAHGYKALGNGTYYGYFKPQFAEFGIDCDMLNWTKTYGKPDHANHKKVEEMLKQGYYFIALMLKGLWTTGGHFVVLWWQDGKVRINDPASTKDARLNGDIQTFRSQCAYYWWVDARKFNGYGTAVKPPVASSGTPATGSAPSLGLKVGDIVEFTGTTHYYSANASKPATCKPGQAKVTQLYNGKHPYQLIAVEGGGSTVYGWVDEKDIRTDQASKTVAVGSTVNIKAGAVYGGLASSRGAKVPSYVSGVRRYTVKQIATHKGVKEALLSEINSWVDVAYLTVV